MYKVKVLGFVIGYVLVAIIATMFFQEFNWVTWLSVIVSGLVVAYAIYKAKKNLEK